MLLWSKKKSGWNFLINMSIWGGCPKQPKMAVFGQKSEEQRKRGWVIESSIARTIIISWIVNILMMFEKKFFLGLAHARAGSNFDPQYYAYLTEKTHFLSQNSHFCHLCLLYAYQTTFFFWDNSKYIMLRYLQ